MSKPGLYPRSAHQESTPKNSTQRFTFIELLIVTAISGMLATLLTPTLLAAQNRAYDRGARGAFKVLQAITQIDIRSAALIGTTGINSSADGVDSGCRPTEV